MDRAPALIPRLRMWILLLLAAIGMQAAAPIRAPLDRAQGSAFSASTFDVALAAPRRAVDNRISLPQPTPPAPASTPKVMPVQAVFAVALPPHLRPEPRGPPPRSHPARRPDSTAPPLA